MDETKGHPRDDVAPRSDRLSDGEITKDAVQDTLEAAATAVGTMAAVITGAVRDVVRALGDFGTEVFEIRESVRRARRDEGQ